MGSFISMKSGTLLRNISENSPHHDKFCVLVEVLSPSETKPLSFLVDYGDSSPEVLYENDFEIFDSNSTICVQCGTTLPKPNLLCNFCTDSGYAPYASSYLILQNFRRLYGS